MKIYLDSEYRCHVHSDGTMKEVETDFFEGMCDAYIEGYRFIPAGEIWVRPDGIEFHGEMIAPCSDYVILQAKQLQTEQAVRKELAALIDALYEEVTS